jgi:uncharacterized delta-60 repeat protein
MRRALGFVTLALACVSCTLLVDTGGLAGGAASGDGGSSEGGTVPDEGGTSTGAFFLSSAPTLTLPNLGTNITLTVNVERKGAFAGAVSIAVADNANGLSAPPLVIPAGATSGTLAVASAASGRLGTFDLELRGTSGADSATARVRTHVGGPSGTIDRTFGDQGVALVACTPGTAARAFNVVVQPDGKPILGGSCIADKTDFFAARFLVDGKLDPNFGDGGKVAWDFSNSDDFGVSVSLLADGRILMSGATADNNDASHAEFGIVRLLPNGKPDTGWGDGGFEASDTITGGFDSAVWTFPLADGKVLVAGNQFSAARYLPTGLLDKSYGQNGTSVHGIGNIDDASLNATLTKAGGLVLTGYSAVSGLGDDADYDWVIERFTPEGRLDVSFGNGGFLKLGFGTKKDRAGGCVELDDGSYFIVGHDAMRGIVTKLTPNGQVDKTFGAEGFVFFATPNRESYAAQLTRQGDHVLVIGGRRNEQNNMNPAILKLDLTGALDTTFGVDGLTVGPISQGNDWAYNVTTGPNGYIYVAGEVYESGDIPRALLFRLWP